MLFGAHVYARAKVFPDVAITKGEAAYAAARSLGDPALEFAIAGSVAMSCLDIGDIQQAEAWLGRAAAVAAAAPTSHRAREIESWRGRIRAAAGDAAGMREHLGRATQLAMEQGRPAARCEALARLALESARLGSEQNDEALLSAAERAANEAKTLAAILPGHHLWGEHADAALARVALTRGDTEIAAAIGRGALHALDEAFREDLYLDLLLPAAEAVIAGGSVEEAEGIRGYLKITLALVSQHILDDSIRVRWLRSYPGRDLVRLAGPLSDLVQTQPSHEDANGFAAAEDDLMRLLAEGLTNREIAEELQTTEEAVASQLAELFAKIGTSSRSEATALALMGRLV
jgi:DNA-binding NarL/FixJ family response regulator